MKKLYLIRNYLIYRAKCVNEHGVHSPFVYDLLLSTIYNRKSFYAYEEVEKIRQGMLLSKQKLNCIDLGAGSHVQNKTSKSVSEIATAAAKPAKYAQ